MELNPRGSEWDPDECPVDRQMENPQSPLAVNTANIQWQTDGRTDGEPALDVGGSPPTFTACGPPTHGSGICKRLLMWVGPPDTMRGSLGRLRMCVGRRPRRGLY